MLFTSPLAPAPIAVGESSYSENKRILQFLPVYWEPWINTLVSLTPGINMKLNEDKAGFNPFEQEPQVTKF